MNLCDNFEVFDLLGHLLTLLHSIVDLFFNLLLVLLHLIVEREPNALLSLLMMHLDQGFLSLLLFVRCLLSDYVPKGESTFFKKGLHGLV